MKSKIVNRWLKSLMFLLSFATVGFGFFFSAFAAAVASVFVLVCASIVVNRRDWSIAMGIVPSRGAIGWFLSTLLLSMLLATLSVMTLLQTKPHLKIELTSAPLLLAVTVLLQSFVEEVLFRVYLMNKIFRRFFNSEILLCFCSAAFFSLAHLLNYRMSEGVSLSPAPLLFLFLIGFAGSGLYLRQGHILGAWGFHAGWNAVRFAVVLLSDGNRVAESMTFELLEGSWLCLGLSGGLVALSLIHQRRRTRP